ncbi:MAG: hypothetical protein LBH87_01880, partial [Coriobacteriales bacterium]|nr:hypothetical protein [Coriobacteriales bacterium]
MKTGEKRWLAASATPWDGVDEAELTPAQALVAASHRSAHRFRHESFEGDADFFNGFKRDTCPFCYSTRLVRFGFDATGIQRYRCTVCRKTSTSVTGTIFEDRKLPLSAWSDFLIQLFSYESINAITREDRRSVTTIPYWLGKVLAVLDGIQDETILSGRVQIDETYHSVPAAEAVSVDGKLLRGLSRNKICIGIGCDDSGRSYFAMQGHGKTSSKKTLETFGSHI